MNLHVACMMCTVEFINNEMAWAMMHADGPLYTNEKKDQTQIYRCDRCNSVIQITINTLEEQE